MYHKSLPCMIFCFNWLDISTFFFVLTFTWFVYFDVTVCHASTLYFSENNNASLFRFSYTIFDSEILVSIIYFEDYQLCDINIDACVIVKGNLLRRVLLQNYFKWNTTAVLISRIKNKWMMLRCRCYRIRNIVHIFFFFFFH